MLALQVKQKHLQRDKCCLKYKTIALCFTFMHVQIYAIFTYTSNSINPLFIDCDIVKFGTKILWANFNKSYIF